MKEPLVSIITPVRNAVKDGRIGFLKQCIERVHAQTYGSIEHILQDGMSNDGTLDVLEEYEAKGWIKLYSEKDIGVHDAINKAVAKSNGELLAIISSDDYYKDDDIISHMVSFFTKEKGVDYVYGDEEHISVDTGKYIRTWKGDSDAGTFWYRNTFNTETMLFSKKIFNLVGGFDNNYQAAADLKLQMSFKISDFKGVYCGRVVDIMRMGRGISSNPSTMFISKKDVSDICCWLWKQFEPEMTPCMAEHMLEYNDYSEIFLRKLRYFLINKKLRNFDYISFNSEINELIRTTNLKKNNDICTDICVYPLKNVPIIRIKQKGNSKKIYILGIPIMKINIK